MRYTVFLQWSYVEPQYEKCTISEALESDFYYDGFNFISGANRDGVSLDIYDNLESAILNSGFNPEHIEFDGNIDKNLILQILDKYDWDIEQGYVKKGIK